MVEVIVRQKARNQLAKILEYAYQEYGKTTLNRFIDELEHIENRLSIQPESYPLEYLLLGRKRKYRFCTLKKNFKIIYYYRPRLKQVVIVSVWDQRMNPETLKKNV